MTDLRLATYLLHFSLLGWMAHAQTTNCGGNVDVGDISGIVWYQKVGEDVTFETTDGTRDTTLWFIKRTGDSTEKLVQTTDNTDNFERDGDNLVLKSLSMSENGMEVRYERAVQGNLGYKSESVKLLVGEIPFLELLSPGDVSLTEISSTPLIISVNTTGIPIPELEILSSNGSSTDAAKFSISDSQAVIENLEISDGGSYQIRASNCFGKHEVWVNVTILVEITLESIGGHEKSAGCGSNVTLTCLSLGFPEANMTWAWSKGSSLDARVSSSVEPTSVHSDGHRKNVTSTLLITDLTREDGRQGPFQCKAENQLGSETLDFNINVLCSPGECGLEIRDISNVSVSASIEAPSNNGGHPITGYSISIKTPDEIIQTKSIEKPGQILFINLRPWTEYNITCSAENDLGRGPSHTQGFKTFDRPGLVDNITLDDRKCRLLALKLISSADTRRPIDIYEVSYQLAGSSSSKINIVSTKDVVFLTDVLSLADYTVQARLVNSYGAGKFSHPFPFQAEFCPDTLKVADPSGSTISNGAVAGIVSIVVVLFMVIIILVVVKQRRKDQYRSQRDTDAKPDGKWKRLLVDQQHFMIKPERDDGIQCYHLNHGDFNGQALMRNLRKLKLEDSLGDLFEKYEVFLTLTHPNVAPLLALNVQQAYDGKLAAFWPFQSCVSLKDYLENHPAKLKCAKKVAMEIAHGMDFLNKKGIVHNALSVSACIMDRKSGQVKVSEYHLAHCLKGATYEEVIQLLGDSRKHWLPVECLRYRNKPVFSVESDVYAYGVTLLETFYFLDDKVKDSLFSTDSKFSDARQTYEEAKAPDTIKAARSNWVKVRQQLVTAKKPSLASVVLQAGRSATTETDGGRSESLSSSSRKSLGRLFRHQLSRQATNMSSNDELSDDKKEELRKTKEEMKKTQKQYKETKKLVTKTPEYRKDVKEKKLLVVTESKQLRKETRNLKRLKTQESTDGFSKPSLCPVQYFNLMKECWSEKQKKRPSFSKIIEVIENIPISHDESDSCHFSSIHEEEEDEEEPLETDTGIELTENHPERTTSPGQETWHSIETEV